MDADRDVDKEQMSHFGDGTECCGAPHIQTGEPPTSPSIQERLRRDIVENEKQEPPVVGVGLSNADARSLLDHIDRLEEALRTLVARIDKVYVENLHREMLIEEQWPLLDEANAARALLSPQGTCEHDGYARCRKCGVTLRDESGASPSELAEARRHIEQLLWLMGGESRRDEEWSPIRSAARAFLSGASPEPSAPQGTDEAGARTFPICDECGKPHASTDWTPSPPTKGEPR